MSDKKPRRGVLATAFDPRVLVGLAVSGLALFVFLRGVSWADMGAAIARANFWVLILPSVPAYVGSIWVRALRWRYLTAAVAPIEHGPLFRATAVGFMVNNVVPLRIGEVVRAFYLSRETGVSASALFGTVIVERVIDASFVLLLAAVVLGTFGIPGLDAGATLATLGMIVILPMGFLALLRLAPEPTLGLAARILHAVLPQGLANTLESALRGLAEGLAGLRGGSSLAWVLLYSAALWLVFSTVPFGAAVLALGVDFGGVAALIQASLTVLVCVGAAVAVPSAPGFVGSYHWAAETALRPFGVDPAVAQALAILAHAVFWVTLTGLGLGVLWWRGMGLGETLASAEEA